MLSTSSEVLDIVRDSELGLSEYVNGPSFDSSLGAAFVGSVSVGSPSADVYALDPQPLNANVVLYQGTFDGRQMQLVVPYQNFSQLDVIDGQLVNVSNSSVTGRFLDPGSTFDPTDYEYSSYTLQSLYGSPTNILRYGSANYQRTFYENDRGSISYDDVYGAFYVTDYDVFYSTSERGYYALFFVIALLLYLVIVCRRK